MTQHRYVPLLRPASFATLPRGVSWGYVEAPAMAGLTRQTDLPASRHRYGVIATDRPLTADELERYDLRGDAAPVPSADESITVTVTRRQHATILAALRFWAAHTLTDDKSALLMDFRAISTDCGELQPLDDGEVADLCDTLNDCAAP